jgi:hypothetical protein
MALTKALGGSGGGGGITELTGDVTAGPGSGAQAATLAAGAVDIAHHSATGTPSSSTYLRGDNTWSTPSGATLSYCRVRKSTGGTVSSGGAFTAFPFDTEDADASGMHSTVTNTTRVTIGTSGRYVICGEWTNAVLTNGYCGIQLRKNGTTVLASHGVGYNNTGGVALTTSIVVDLVATDYIEMGYVSGINTSYDATTHSPRLEVAQIA